MWKEILDKEKNKEYFKEMWEIIENDYKNEVVFPPKDEVFKAFELTKYKDIKVVILGQDPYHGDNQANGLCFSVKEGVKTPPSLRNMFKELDSDLGIKRENADLTNWASQGIFLLNAFLTVKKSKPLSHSKIGWNIFCNNIIKEINKKNDKVIFLLMGNFAKSKKKFIDENKHEIIEVVHPSPLSASRGFLGSKVFSKINKKLTKKINW